MPYLRISRGFIRLSTKETTMKFSAVALLAACYGASVDAFATTQLKGFGVQVRHISLGIRRCFDVVSASNSFENCFTSEGCYSQM